MEARRSPDALSVFRNLCGERGHSTSTVQRLGSRTSWELGTLVWFPDSFSAHKPAVADWLEDWLMAEDKTLIYVGRDYSAYADYWNDIGNRYLVPSSPGSNAKRGLEAKTVAATAEAELSAKRWNVRPKQILPWGIHDHTRGGWTQGTRFAGQWAKFLDGTDHRILFRSVLKPFDTVDMKSLRGEFDWKPTTTNTGNVASPAKPNRGSKQWQDEDQIYLDRLESYLDGNSFEYTSEVLLATSEGTPLITRLTSDWASNSQIILVSTPSLLTNYSLTHSGNWNIAEELVKALPDGRVGFLSGVDDPKIVDIDGSEQQKGFEMLTTWPLNIITLHAAFIGMLVLLALFPIFGRAKSLPERSSQDFSQHIDALGALLYKSDDRSYALATIADYFKNVRKDIHSPWAHHDSPKSEN